MLKFGNWPIPVFTFAAVLAAQHTPAPAATFTARAQGSGCEALDSGPVSASADCPASFGASSGGRLSAYAVSNGIRPQGGGPLATTGSTQATASFLDTLFFGVDEGTFTIPVDFHGSAFNQIIRSLPGAGGARISYSVSGGFGKYLSGETVRFGYQAQIIETPGRTTVTEDGDLSLVQELTLPFSGGVLRIFGGLRTDASCLDVGGATSCTAEMDYSSSLRLLGGTLRDLNGNILAGVSVTSDSGFDYLAGVPPHNRPAVVPLPAGFPLLLGALAALAGIGCRRSARAAKLCRRPEA